MRLGHHKLKGRYCDAPIKVDSIVITLIKAVMATVHARTSTADHTIAILIAKSTQRYLLPGGSVTLCSLNAHQRYEGLSIIASTACEMHLLKISIPVCEGWRPSPNTFRVTCTITVIQ